MKSTPKRTSNSVWNPRVFGYQKCELDRPLTQALAELPHEWIPGQRNRQRPPVQCGS